MRSTLITAAGSRREDRDGVDSTPVIEAYRTRSAARRARLRTGAAPASAPHDPSELIAS